MQDYIEKADKYRKDVLADKKHKKYCKLTYLAVKRSHNDHVKNRKNTDWKYYFDAEAGNNVCDFIEKLPHVEGVWESPYLILEPWQIFILSEVFGWKRRLGDEPSDLDPRRFNTVYIELGRKNGKSALSSGVALYCLCCDNEPGPQIKTAATTGDQARIVFDVAKSMALQTPALMEYFDLKPMANSIPCFKNSGHIKPINAKASTQDGLNPHLTIIDELHAHSDRSLFDVLKSARGARKNPLSWYITTAGYNMEGVCFEQRSFVEKVLKGVLQGDHYFGIIFTLDKGDDAFDPENWHKANPNLGVSVNEEELRGYAEEAKQSPASEGEFKTKRCNLWLNASEAWLNMAQWDSCYEDIKIEDFREEEAWIGVDLSERRDVTGIVIMFRRKSQYFVFPRFYLPKDLVDEAAHKTTTHYKAWAREGLFTLTRGDYIDPDHIENDIKELCREHNVQEVIFDQRDNPTLFIHLEDAGIEVVQILKNAANFSDPSKEFEALIQANRFVHDGHPCLKWMASNCTVDRRVDGSILPKKESKHSKNKIDGIDCIIQALARAITIEVDDYEPPIGL